MHVQGAWQASSGEHGQPRTPSLSSRSSSLRGIPSHEVARTCLSPLADPPGRGHRCDTGRPRCARSTPPACSRWSCSSQRRPAPRPRRRSPRRRPPRGTPQRPRWRRSGGATTRPRCAARALPRSRATRASRRAMRRAPFRSARRAARGGPSQSARAQRRPDRRGAVSARGRDRAPSGAAHRRAKGALPRARAPRDRGVERGVRAVRSRALRSERGPSARTHRASALAEEGTAAITERP